LPCAKTKITARVIGVDHFAPVDNLKWQALESSFLALIALLSQPALALQSVTYERNEAFRNSTNNQGDVSIDSSNI